MTQPANVFNPADREVARGRPYPGRATPIHDHRLLHYRALKSCTPCLAGALAAGQRLRMKRTLLWMRNACGPRFIEFLPELPKTATGQIQRFRLRERPARP